MINWMLQHNWIQRCGDGYVFGNGYVVWALYTLFGVICKLFNLWFGRRILAHSDGGGWDAGTDYSYVPDLKKEYSRPYDEEWGYYAQNNRVKVLQWCLLPIFSFISIFASAGYILCWIEYFFSNNYVTPYASSEMRTSGKQTEWS